MFNALDVGYTVLHSPLDNLPSLYRLCYSSSSTSTCDQTGDSTSSLVMFRAGIRTEQSFERASRRKRRCQGGGEAAKRSVAEAAGRRAGRGPAGKGVAEGLRGRHGRHKRGREMCRHHRSDDLLIRVFVRSVGCVLTLVRYGSARLHPTVRRARVGNICMASR